MKKASYTESLEPDIAGSTVESQRRAMLKERATDIASSERKLLHCPLCSCFYVTPITLNCGHTLCKSCILSDNVDKNSVIDCKQCGIRNHTTELAVNVLLTRLIQKWFPIEYESEVKKLEDVQRGGLQQGEQKKVVETLSDVLHNSPCNFTAVKWRSHALYQMGMYKQALRDAELACVLRPFLPIGFYLRGLILVAMKNYENAALSFAHCLVLDATNSAEYHSQLFSCLIKLLSSDSDTFGKERLGLERCEDSRTTENNCNRSKFTSNNKCESRDESLGDIQAKESPKSTISDSSSSSSSSSSASPVAKPVFSEKQPSLKRPLEESTSLPISASRSKSAKVTEHDAGTSSCMQESTARSKDDLICELCYSVLFQPVTTSCGHTFCRECLQRSLDFRPECPYCRKSLNCIIARNRELNIVVKEITEKLFPDDFAARERSFANEKTRWKGCGVDDDVDVPIFVCMSAFPSLNYPLHIFEPRYRLMIRRCVELGSRMFGICANDPDVGFSEYGTILYIDTIDVLPDGRSIIQTTARTRFRVISRAVSDGYDTAKVQWLQDETPNNYTELIELEALNVECSTLLERWFYSLTQLQQICITNAIGPIPPFEENLVSSPNGPSWVWWALAAVPLQDRAKLIILAMTTLEERLKSIRRFLDILVTMNSNS